MSTPFAELRFSAATVESKVQFGVRNRAFLIGAVTIASDFLSISLAIAAALACSILVNSRILSLPPIVLLLPIITVALFAAFGHYPGLGLTAVCQLRNMCRGIAMVYLIFVSSLFLEKELSMDSRGVLRWPAPSRGLRSHWPDGSCAAHSCPASNGVYRWSSSAPEKLAVE